MIVLSLILAIVAGALVFGLIGAMLWASIRKSTPEISASETKEITPNHSAYGWMVSAEEEHEESVTRMVEAYQEQKLEEERATNEFAKQAAELAKRWNIINHYESTSGIRTCDLMLGFPEHTESSGPK